jgi:Fur family ferric uptake transcriptional regulator
MRTWCETLLKEHGLSLTSVRVALLETLCVNPHSDATLLFEGVKAKLSTASMQAIYNNLNTLVEHGIVREIKPKGRPSLYETRVGDNHHHLVCRHCQLIVDTDCLDVAPCLTPTHNHGFTIDEAEIVLWGICPDCQKNLNLKKENK